MTTFDSLMDKSKAALIGMLAEFQTDRQRMLDELHAFRMNQVKCRARVDIIRTIDICIGIADGSDANVR